MSISIPPAQLWDGAAAAWERHAALVDSHTAAATRLMLERAEVAPGDLVLDLAAGPGGAGLAAAAITGPSGWVVLSDVAPEMVAAAARRAGALPQVSTMVCDLADIAADDATFDAVLCRHGLMFAADPTAAVDEITRVLRPGGRLAAATWAARGDNPWLGLLLDAVGAQFDMAFPPPGLPGPFALDDPALLADTLTAGGLADVTVEHVRTPMHVASLDAWWAQVPELAGPLAQALAGMEDDVRAEIRARACASAAAVARRVADGLVLDGEILVAAGRRPG